MRPQDTINYATPDGKLDPSCEFGLTLLYDPDDAIDIALALLCGEVVWEEDHSGELFLSDTDGREERAAGLESVRLPLEIRRAAIAGGLGWDLHDMTCEKSVWWSAFTRETPHG